MQRIQILGPLALPCALLAAACDPGLLGYGGNPLQLPGAVTAGSPQQTATQSRRGAVELFVKTNHPALVADIAAGAGPVLDQAIGLAAVTEATRSILILRLRSDLALYRRSPDALVLALLAHAG